MSGIYFRIGEFDLPRLSLDDEGIVSLVASQELSVSSALHHSLEAVATHLSEHELKLFSEIARLSWRIVGAYLLR